MNTVDDEDEEYEILDPQETPIVRDIEDSDDASEINLKNDDAQDHSEDDEENEESEIKITDKVVSAMKKLMTSYNPEATKIVEDSKLKAGEIEAGIFNNFR